MATFYWRSSSSPAKTDRALARLGGSRPSINVDHWRTALQPHPDRTFVDNLLRGFEEGFPLGYTGPRVTRPIPRSRLSAEEQQHVLSEFEREKDLGRMAGPFEALPDDLFPFFIVSPTFTIDKADGSYRRIDNLSFPEGQSVNDGILKQDFPVNFASYASVRHAIASAEDSCKLSSRDISEAYRHVLIAPWDWPLLVAFVDDKFWVNFRGPFGARSMAGIFSLLGETCVWIFNYYMSFTGIECILDDFLFIHRCSLLQEISLSVADDMRQVDMFFDYLGLPIKHAKSVTGVSCIQFMGVLWDVSRHEVSLPPDKCTRYRAALRQIMLGRRRFPVAEFHSLVGKLGFVAQFCLPARCRLYHIYAALFSALGRKARYVFLGPQALIDLEWFHGILLGRPSTFLTKPFPTDSPFVVTTDGAPSYGVGGFWGDREFSIPLLSCEELHSTFVELLALVVAIALWGPDWSGHTVLWRTDCECHLKGLHKIRVRAPRLLPLHNFIDTCQVSHNFQLVVEHIDGESNTRADRLSRGDVSSEATIGPLTWEQQLKIPLPAQIYSLFSQRS